MLVASHPFALFDYLRVPYRVEPEGGSSRFGTLRGAGGVVSWPVRFDAGLARRGFWSVAGSPVFATLADDAALAEVAGELGSGWADLAPVEDADGNRAAAVRRSGDGALLLPFDPGDAMVSFWSEAYRTEGAGSRGRIRRLAMSGYYLARPALPRSVQLRLRRSFSRIQMRSSFPRWPTEPALHDLYASLLAWLAQALGEPLPGIAPWPRGKRWALVLTHDVEHEAGYRSIPLMRDLELALGYRSAWYLVPERDYDVEDEVVTSLAASGFEVGVHGLRHDGRDLVPSVLAERRAAIRDWGARWGAVGFRAPALHRDWELMPELGFDYDSSSFDTDPFEPQPGGCCTWLPFHNRDLVELPITLTMDHTVFEILRRDASLWHEKADALRDRGGLALLLTHPDYVAPGERLSAYESFLRRYADDDTAWRPLPRELADWWRRRSASRIEPGEDGALRVVGPARDEAEIVLLG